MKYFIKLIVLFPLLAQANEQNISLNEITCTTGTLSQLYDFFADQNYVVVAQGRQLAEQQKQKNFPDTLFLVSAQMDYFHLVTLIETGQNKYQACISLSAREVDLQIRAPIDNLLARKNREHYLHISEMPKDGECAAQNSHCIPWQSISYIFNRKPLISGYEYSVELTEDPYNEVVELTIDGQTIHPTRGALTELARTKYALRLTNQLNESKEDIEAAKEIYKNIHSDVDHKLPLIILNLTGNDKWSIYKIDRAQGLVWEEFRGDDFKTFPLEDDTYKQFVKTSN